MLSNSGKCTDSSPIAINQLNKEAKSQQPNQWRRSQPLAVWTFSDRNISSLFMMIALFRWRNKRWKHQMFSVRIMSFKCSRVCRSVFDLTWQESEWRKRKITHTQIVLSWTLFKRNLFGVVWTTLIGDLKSSSLILKCLLCFGYRFYLSARQFGRCHTIFKIECKM